MKFFLEHLDTPPEDDCLPWPYTTDREGYGQLRWEGKMRRVPALVCEHHYGPRPPGMTARHALKEVCSLGPNCWSYRHLSWGTWEDQAADSARTPSQSALLSDQQSAPRHRRSRASRGRPRQIRTDGLREYCQLALSRGAPITVVDKSIVGDRLGHAPPRENGVRGGQVRHCQLGQVRATLAHTACGCGPRSAGTRRHLPFRVGPSSEEAVVSGSEQMAPDAKQVLDRTVNGCESLQLGRRFEAPHLAFPLPRWLM